MNLPNKLTILRICMVPFFIACFYIKSDFSLYIAAVVFILAYITDAVDGHLARKNGQVTDFGKLMDPIADKLLSCSALIMLAAWGFAHPVAVIIILSREFLISGVRLVCADKGVIIAASKWGKLKTISQAICIPVIMVARALSAQVQGLGWTVIFADILLWISVALALVSAVDYIYKNRSCLSFNN